MMMMMMISGLASDTFFFCSLINYISLQTTKTTTTHILDFVRLFLFIKFFPFCTIIDGLTWRCVCGKKLEKFINGCGCKCFDFFSQKKQNSKKEKFLWHCNWYSCGHILINSTQILMMMMIVCMYIWCLCETWWYGCFLFFLVVEETRNFFLMTLKFYFISFFIVFFLSLILINSHTHTLNIVNWNFKISFFLSFQFISFNKSNRYLVSQ